MSHPGELRSPEAFRHDPVVTKREFLTEASMTGADVFSAARDEGGYDDETWARILDHGGIHLRGHRLSADRLPRLVPTASHVAVYSLSADPVRLALDERSILHDDDGIVAVAKPAWFATQGTRASRLCSLEHAARELTGCTWLTPAHRLDRETSGVVLFARDRDAASRLGRQFEQRTIQKRYSAVVSPMPAQDSWTVSGYMYRIEHPAHSLFALASDEPSGQASRFSKSHFLVEERRGARARVLASPETGRTHQLRVHLAESGCPIVGDGLYGPGYVSGSQASANRLQLHALELSFRPGGPGVGEELTVRCEPPGDFGLEAS